MEPLISIVMATYNRSGILRYSINSVIRQTYSNWELIVIGDHCTDDTQEVVASFRDPRITFINLPVRHGEQSAANNAGVEQAHGDVIAFLNHDDLWMESHLELCMNRLTETGADLVYGLAMNIETNDRLILVNSSFEGRYIPTLLVPATTWCLKRSLHAELNGWRSGYTLYNVPSQDFLFRAWKKKKKMVLVPELTSILIPSGFRKNSYLDTAGEEHAAYFEHILASEGFRSKIFTTISLSEQSNYTRTLPVTAVASRLLKNTVLTIIMAIGLHPSAVRHFFRFRKKGGFIQWLRRHRGIPQQGEQ